ncbi:MAG: family 16 glycoside hydrolase [Planctomycetota bacterium]|nr:family 16 glycoside hydrolase [Planctomycetota bacterium]
MPKNTLTTVLHTLLGAAALFALSILIQKPAVAADDAEGKSLFNGKDLTGWDGDPKYWKVEDGAIVGQTTAENPISENSFLIWKDGEVDDFELRLKYRINGGNSGVQYRSKRFPPDGQKVKGNWVVGGYQADLEAGDGYTGILYEERKSRGIMAMRGESVTFSEDGKKTVGAPVGDGGKLQESVKKNDWNDYTIIAKGNKLTHIINGKKFVEVVDNDAKKRALSGVLALQVHTGPAMKVEFKDIKLKRTKLAAVDGIGDRNKIVMVAGSPSHGPGDHEFNAGTLLLKKCLDESVPGVVTAVYRGGWPTDMTAFDNADTIMLYMDGGGGHPLIKTRERLAEIDYLMKHGVGLVCAHYAVEIPKEKGGPDLLNWIGGYFEMHWSVNPHWTMKQAQLAKDHPITRGVDPFEMRDEWYYHMRFRDNMQGVTPILSAVPPEETRQKADGTHSGNPTVRSRTGQPEIVAWACEREDGGRGFGFTGGHFHKNWGDDNCRKLFLNALVWTAKGEVPNGGIQSKVTEEELKANLDPKQK